jgi:V/A-type H+-transporting ATPase subunit E
MDYENLMKSMDAGAEDKLTELMQKARKTSAEIKSRALAKAAEIKKLHMDGASKAAMLERNKSFFTANSEAKKQIGSLKHELFNEAFARARERLVSARESGNYEDSFRKMAEEAVRALGESEVVLHIDKRDMDLCRKVADGLGIRCEILADNSCMGGLIATTMDGKVVVHNTLESRLENARRRMRLEIFNMLHGDSR